MKTNKLIVLSILTIILSACGSSSVKSLTGAGATFPLPYYKMAFDQYYENNSVSINYGGVGSGGGIRSLGDQVVDFAGSDAYLSEEEMNELPSEVLHIPSCMGAIVLAYNLPNIGSLNLDGEVLADIFMGKITKWNDDRIKSINEGVALPDIKITTIYRSDGSGSTFVFSDYLSKVSPEWKSEMGVSKSLKWDIGIAAKGNTGVAGILKQSEGSIAYLGSEYAFALKIPMANLKNASGHYIAPSSAAISAAATGEMPSDMRVMITNSQAEDAYPISLFTWLLIYKEQNYNGRSIELSKENIKMIKWMLSPEGQSLTKKINYCPLPAKAIEISMKALEEVTYNGEKLI